MKIHIYKIAVLMMVLPVGCGSPEVSDKSTKPEVAQPKSPAVDEARTNSNENELAMNLAVGDKAPDFEIELMGGEMLKLSEHVLTCGGPTILVFNRAHW